MKRRYWALAIAILLLGALNLLQWKTTGAPGHERSAAPSGSFGPEDFRLKVGLAMAESAPAGRNLEPCPVTNTAC